MLLLHTHVMALWYRRYDCHPIMHVYDVYVICTRTHDAKKRRKIYADLQLVPHKHTPRSRLASIAVEKIQKYIEH